MIIIDRFEGDFAVCETEDGMIDIKADLLPAQAREGDVIRLENGKYIIDEQETNARKAKASEMLEGLKHKKK